MAKSEREKNTQTYYNLHSADFLSFRGKEVSKYWSKELDYFQKLLPQGTILEVGCGTGNETKIFKERGYDYVGVDNSIGMLSVAKSRCPEADFICQDLRWLGLSSKFDGLIAIASLLHLEKDELVTTLSNLRHHLRQGGMGFFTFKKGVGTEVDGKGRFYSYYSPEELSEHISDSGFTLLDLTVHNEKDHDFICCFVLNS